MKIKSNRVKQLTTFESILRVVRRYAYFETSIIVTLYLALGFLVDSADVCILDGEISYILILLAVITLFHGFENGILAVGMLAVAMWLFYDTFQYVEFLSTLVMTMIFSEFHYYWTKKIKEAEINADYRGVKLEELSKAFYSLKISHDQLEKNYVIKPMSIRNSIESIINMEVEINENVEIADKDKEFYIQFMGLLEKSFNVHNAMIVYKKDYLDDALIDEESAGVIFGHDTEDVKLADIFKDYLVDKAVSRKTSIYISDEDGEPSEKRDDNSEYIAALPAMHNDEVVAVLVIEKMPFMAFNRENLTSISILFDYFSIEIRNKDVLSFSDEISIIPDQKFKFEYSRLKYLFDEYEVSSVSLVLRVENELQSIRIYEKIEKTLRSLDMLTSIKQNGHYYIILMFPLHDKASALGYMERLTKFLDAGGLKDLDHMIFDMSQTQLLNDYVRDNYGK